MKAHSKPVPKNYRWHVMGIVMIGTMMAALDTSIVNVSIPAIMSDFAAGVDEIEWVMTAYMIAFATLMPLTSWFRDRIGYKNLYITSLIIFTIGSLMCGAAWNMPTLITARVIQALGGGAITPTGMAMISEVFPPKERGKAIGIWGLGVILGPAFGPTVGGYLTHTLGWRSIFLINLPIGIVACIASYRFLIHDKPHRSTHRPFDLWGFIFLSLLLISLLLGLSKGEKEGWTSAYIVTCGIIAVISLIGFLLVETNISYGIIDLGLFSSPVFTACASVSLVRSIALYGGMFLLPLFIQQQMGYDEMQSGLMLLPGSLVLALLMPFGGKLGDKVGPKIPTIVGLAFLATFMFMYYHADPAMSVFAVIAPTMIRGVGFSFLMAPITAAAMNAVPQRKAGMASSMLSIIQQIGGSVGIVILGTVLTNRARYHLDIIGSAMNGGNPSFMASLHAIAQHVHELGYTYLQSAQIAQSLLFQKIAQTATVMSFQDAFIVGGIIVVLSIIPAFLLPGKITHHVSTAKIENEVGVEISSSD
jgi:MFS transporter, DHA2 family, multidrug resistance protein